MVSAFAIKRPRERSIVALILAAGAAARLAWVFMGQGLKPYLGESHNVALSLVKSGRFADPMANGGGFTAHVSMLTPLPSALAYWLLGVDTPYAETALSLWAIGLVTASLWLCWRIACALDVLPAARIAAVALAALVPLQFNLEVREGRSWEVDLAATLLIWLFLRLILADRNGASSDRNLAGTGAISGLLFIISPPAGLAAVVTIGIFLIKCVKMPRWWIAPAAFVIVAGSMAGIWAERNVVRLGAAIALRDNFGLELDISNYGGAVHPSDPRAAYLSRIEDIHPLMVGPANEKLRAAGGEVAYYRQLGKEAEGWIKTHPSDFLYLSARRFVEYYLPPKWFWGTFGAISGRAVWLRQLLVWATVLPGIMTLIVLAMRQRLYLYLLVGIFCCSLPYIVVQPILRYRYLVSSLLIFAAFDGMSRLVAYFLRRRAKNRSMSAIPSPAWQNEGGAAS